MSFSLICPRSEIDEPPGEPVQLGAGLVMALGRVNDTRSSVDQSLLGRRDVSEAEKASIITEANLAQRFLGVVDDVFTYQFNFVPAFFDPLRCQGNGALTVDSFDGEFCVDPSTFRLRFRDSRLR